MESRPISSRRNPNVMIEVALTLSAGIVDEFQLLVNACKGDKRDRFGHIKYWKCMLALIPFILRKDIAKSDTNVIAKKIGFSRSQVDRSLDKFVDKGILIKQGSGSYSLYKLNRESIPAIYFFCRKKMLTHIVRYDLSLSAI